MWVLQEGWLYNLRHAVEVGLDGKAIRIGFVDGSRGSLEFGTEAQAKSFFALLVSRLGRLEGALQAEEVPHAREG